MPAPGRTFAHSATFEDVGFGRARAQLAGMTSMAGLPAFARSTTAMPSIAERFRHPALRRIAGDRRYDADLFLSPESKAKR